MIPDAAGSSFCCEAEDWALSASFYTWQLGTESQEHSCFTDGEVGQLCNHWQFTSLPKIQFRLSLELHFASNFETKEFSEGDCPTEPLKQL